MKHVIAILITIFFFQSSTQAAHIIGGEVIYQCISQGNYHVTIKLYRDCNGGGAPFDSSIPGSAQGQVTVYRGDDPMPFKSVLLDAPEITPVDYNIDGCIADLPNLCVQQGVYTFNINLPVSEVSYYIIYQRCCRNLTISNILDPGDTGATYMAEIHRKAQEICNSSAEFNEFPPVLICANEPLVFDHSASDSEGDSLAYGFCTPLKGGDITNLAPNPDTPPPHDPVDFVAPTYAADMPLAGNPVVSIDPQTGLITGTPTLIGQFVLGVCVKEFREGRLINIVQRDFQFNVMPCNFMVKADLNGETSDGEHFLYESCSELEITMLNESYELENIDNFQWEFDLGGTDPLISNDTDLVVLFPETGTYQGLLILNKDGVCKDTAWIQVNIYDPPAVEIEFEFDPCEQGPVTFIAISPTSEVILSDWKWGLGDGTQSQESSVIHTYAEEGIYEVVLSVKDANGCIGTTTTILNRVIETIPELESPPSMADCAPLEVTFDYLLDYLNEDYEVFWDFGDGAVDSGLLVAHIYQEPGNYGLGLQITTPSGCDTILTYENTILVEAPPLAAFEYSPDVVNKMETIQFKDLSERAVEWSWNFGDGGVAIDRDPIWVFRRAENYEVWLTVEDQYGCQDSTFLPLEVRAIAHIYVPNAFSPNNDGINDEFRTYPTCPLEEFQLKIYDRWGGQLFESKDIEEGWSGIYKNELFDPGVFTWLVTFRIRERVHMMRGDVTLLR